MFEMENQHDGIVCGIDEVGRGPLAGPVTAACVIVPEESRHHDFWRIVNDSKKLSAKKRELLSEKIMTHCHYGLGSASPEEIDRLNIHRATLLAMKRAYECLCAYSEAAPSFALVDGKFCPNIDCKALAVIGGDGLCLSISAASILAKTSRDQYMADLHRHFPAYGWNCNSGYGSRQHLDALGEYGPTIYHRKSYAPVRRLLEAA